LAAVNFELVVPVVLEAVAAQMQDLEVVCPTAKQFAAELAGHLAVLPLSALIAVCAPV